MSPPTILIVEDEALIALELEDHFRGQGYEVAVASTIGSAIVRIEQGGIGLCVLDYHLGDLPCTPVAEALRAHRVPFVICSGSPAGFLEDLFAGVPVITKPFDEQVLETIVAATLNHPTVN